MIRILAGALSVASLASCIALVEAPAPLPPTTPCDADNGDACPDGYECGYFSPSIHVDGEQRNRCVPNGCVWGASCKPECSCGCGGCDPDQLCDVQHAGGAALADGRACVQKACFSNDQSEFYCDSVTSSGATIACVPCDGI